MRNGQTVTVREGNAKNIKSAADLCGKIGSASVGGSSLLSMEQQSQACVANGKPAIQLMPAPEMEASYRQLGNQRIDFVMDNTASANSRLEKATEFQEAYSVSTNIAFGAVLAKGNDEMLRIVFDGMRAMRDQGEITKLAVKYKLPTDLLMPIEIRRE
jgi:polar amino acid transport system substrate-binding protein